MIRRSEHSAQNKFLLFNRKTAQNKALTFQARGLLAYVLSKPPKWEAKDTDLMRQGKIKKHALGSILKELKAAGYARRVRLRKKDGTFEFGLEIAEEPEFTNNSPLPDFPVVDDPLADNQVVAIDSTCARAATTPITDQRDNTKGEDILPTKPKKSTPYPSRKDWPKHVAIYFDVTERAPARPVWPLIEQRMGPNPDPARLRECYAAWLDRGFREFNNGWLDWYVNGIPESRKNGNMPAKVLTPDHGEFGENDMFRGSNER